ncbi:type II asparaginase, partial [Campylobacter upsaliensis]|nr:type II asparaginase [Campylobacter upsaliensis]EAI5602854.1 type II asparaginase [Campylobacter upsaliensis]EFM2941697.1 type II asparaginase [Campylobacter upsaliensis]
MKKLLLCMIAFFIVGASMAEAKPKVAILATGGTIAGSIDSAVATTGYTAGVVGVDVLIKAVPEIQNLAKIEGQQIANIDSSNMRDEIWLKLAQEINKLFASGVDGVVITHGTDTMEETAYFLNLTIKSDKPVVLVGAMRPSTAISADGPKNLYNAVALAADKNARGKGVMVAMNDKIQSARAVVKTHTLNVDAFSSPDFGDMGYIVDGKVYFYNNVAKAHTKKTPFDVKNLKELPKVDILYSYSNDGSGVAAKALFENGTKGIVVAGSGAGSIHEAQKEVLKELL